MDRLRRTCAAFRYEPGDVVGIVPVNDDTAVQALLQRMRWSGGSCVRLRPAGLRQDTTGVPSSGGEAYTPNHIFFYAFCTWLCEVKRGFIFCSGTPGAHFHRWLTLFDLCKHFFDILVRSCPEPAVYRVMAHG